MAGILALEYIGIIDVAECIRQRIERCFFFGIIGHTQNDTDCHKANENGHDKFADNMVFLSRHYIHLNQLKFLLSIIIFETSNNYAP